MRPVNIFYIRIITQCQYIFQRMLQKIFSCTRCQIKTAVVRRTCLVLHRLHLCFVFVYNNSLFLFCQVFKYDRFVDAKFYDQAGEEIRHPVMAFGSLCPGKRFAMAQMKLYLLTILTRFDMALDQGEHAEYDFRYHGHEVLPPVKDVNVNFRLKTDSPKLRLVEQRWFEQAWDTFSKRLVCLSLVRSIEKVCKMSEKVAYWGIAMS